MSRPHNWVSSRRPRKKNVRSNKGNSSGAEMRKLPFEILDVILQKSYLLSVLCARRVEPIEDAFYFPWPRMPSESVMRLSNRTKDSNDRNIICKLASVDFCWFKRITRVRSKKAIWRHLAGLYKKLETGAAVVRANKRYLLAAMISDDFFISHLLKANCITGNQLLLIRRRRRLKDRNSMILRAVRFRNDNVYSSFLQCLCNTKQHLVAGVIESGGVVAKVKVTTQKVPNRKMAEQKLSRSLTYCREKARSTEVGTILNTLKMWEMEILQSYQNKGIIIWFWCKTEQALQTLQEWTENKSLLNILRRLFKNLSVAEASGEMLVPRNISIEKDFFTKDVVTITCQKSVAINFCAKLDGLESEYAAGITELGQEIYVLCRSYHSPESNSIRVFENHTRFRLQTMVQIMKIKGPTDIVSNAYERCLYVADVQRDSCVWKITESPEWMGRTQVKKWLSHLGASCSMSVCTSGQLLIVQPGESFSSLEIYDSDAQLVRSVRPEIQKARHAVETSTGNFIVIHKGAAGTEVVSKVSADGTMLLRQFVPTDPKRDLTEPVYLAIDADDRVFVADQGRGGKVVLLDSDLRWNRILCPNTDDSALRSQTTGPWRLFYDAKKRRLMVASGGNAREGGVYVYSLQY